MGERAIEMSSRKPVVQNPMLPSCFNRSTVIGSPRHYRMRMKRTNSGGESLPERGHVYRISHSIDEEQWSSTCASLIHTPSSSLGPSENNPPSRS